MKNIACVDQKPKQNITKENLYMTHSEVLNFKNMTPQFETLVPSVVKQMPHPWLRYTQTNVADRRLLCN